MRTLLGPVIIPLYIEPFVHPEKGPSFRNFDCSSCEPCSDSGGVSSSLYVVDHGFMLRVLL